MPKILAVTEEMQRRASDISSKAGDILSIQNSVTNIFQNMGRDFSGRIPSLMTEKMIAMESVYQSINATLNNYSEFLSDAAQSMEWTDSEAARWSRNLGVGN